MTRPTTWQTFTSSLKVVATIGWIATKYGSAVVVVMLGAGSVLAHRSLFTAGYLQRFMMPFAVYIGSLLFLVLPYLVVRGVRERGDPGRR